MNGVYRRLSGSNVELADIERIEVLRGPQGTLFGRNTLAGAMNVVTRDPGKELSGSIDLGYGAFDTTRARLSVSGPISDSAQRFLLPVAQEARRGLGDQPRR